MESTSDPRARFAAAVTTEQLSGIVARSIPGRAPRSFELLQGGASNLNYRLHFAEGDAGLVLRLYPRDPLACAKEIALLQALNGAVPVPQIVYANEQAEDELGPCLIYRYAEGVTFQELRSKGTSQELAEAAQAIGAVLAQLQSVPVEAALRAVIAPSPFAGDAWLQAPLLEARLGQSARVRLCETIDAWSPQLRALHQETKLVHGDFNNRNTILKQERGRWIVSAILDWELAFIGSPLWDAARFICYEKKKFPLREPHFSRGFSDGGGRLPDRWPELARVISAVSAAQGLTRELLPLQFVPDLVELISRAASEPVASYSGAQ